MMPKLKGPPPPPSLEAREALLAAIRAAPAPLSPTAIGRSVAPPHRIRPKDLPSILGEYAAGGTLHVFPPATAKGPPRYWHKTPDEFARQALQKALDEHGPQTAAKLKKAARGMSDERFRKILEDLLAARAVFRHPPLGRSKVELLAGRPASPALYLQGVAAQLQQIVARLRSAGVGADDLRRALVQLVESAGVSLGGAAPPAGAVAHDGAPAPVDLLALMQRIDAGAARGALVGARALRQAAKLDKSQFDRAVLDLARQGRLSLHRHDYAASLSPAERDELVTDGQGTYFVGMALRQDPQ